MISSYVHLVFKELVHFICVIKFVGIVLFKYSFIIISLSMGSVVMTPLFIFDLGKLLFLFFFLG